MRNPNEADIIGTRATRDECAGLPMFDARTPEEAERDLRDQFIAPPRAKPAAAILGAGQAARRAARESARGTTEEAYRKIAWALESAGPNGLTRKEIEQVTGLMNGTVNGRVAELRDPNATPEHEDKRVITDGRRNGESVCHLKRIHNRSAA